MRASGVLMPILSLPSKHGIGCFSKEAYEFVDCLVSAGQAKWQVLPLGPTGYGDSPYQPFSTFAGNPYFIDLETLVEEGLLEESECNCDWNENDRYVDYGRMYGNRYAVLKKAFARFVPDDDYEEFCEQEKHWLGDYCLFMAIKNDQNGALWTGWPKELRTREEKALESERERLEEEIAFQRFMQYEFDKQWKKVKKYANKKGVTIIGDLPIYVALDSADVWSNPKLFQVDEECLPTAVAGCPPDAFSATGQLWGNPLYDWEYHKETGYQWWLARMKRSFAIFDTVRLDHFRGFAAYYAIPAEDETAEYGEWVEGPGMDLFNTLKKELGELDIIAEDLGTLDDAVFELLADSGYPGMNVLQFAFDTGNSNMYLPHRYKRNSVVYTGTHDNDTTKSWYYEIPDWVRDYSKAYLNNFDRPWEDIAWDFIRAAESSVADLAIIPMWDILNCGSEARMNKPATLGTNWKWRMLLGEFDEEKMERLRRLTDTFQRCMVVPEEVEEAEEEKEEKDQ